MDTLTPFHNRIFSKANVDVSATFVDLPSASHLLQETWLEKPGMTTTSIKLLQLQTALCYFPTEFLIFFRTILTRDSDDDVYTRTCQKGYLLNVDHSQSTRYKWS